jgi:hypothetical protein
MRDDRKVVLVGVPADQETSGLSPARLTAVR